MQINTSTLTLKSRSPSRKGLRTLIHWFLVSFFLGFSATATAQTAPTPVTQSAPESSARESREEILKTFQREAQAAYAEAKKACAALPTAERTVCLAKARLQFDDDMRYATKRADMGY
jgi:hypothetical protein